MSKMTAASQHNYSNSYPALVLSTLNFDLKIFFGYKCNERY